MNLEIKLKTKLYRNRTFFSYNTLLHVTVTSLVCSLRHDLTMLSGNTLFLHSLCTHWFDAAVRNITQNLFFPHSSLDKAGK